MMPRKPVNWGLLLISALIVGLLTYAVVAFWLR